MKQEAYKADLVPAFNIVGEACVYMCFDSASYVSIVRVMSERLIVIATRM